MANDDRIWEVQNKGFAETRHASEDSARRYSADRTAYYLALSKQEQWRGLEVPTFDVESRPAFEVAHELWFENLYVLRHVAIKVPSGIPDPGRSGFDATDPRRYILRTSQGTQLGTSFFDGLSRGGFTHF